MTCPFCQHPVVPMSNHAHLHVTDEVGFVHDKELFHYVCSGGHHFFAKPISEDDAMGKT